MIPSWLRITVILALLIVWVVFVLVSVARGTAIDPLVWGIPGGFFLLLGPGLKGRGGDGPD